MKLQKKLNRKIGNDEYFKWYIPVSPDDVAKLKWKKGESLSARISGKKLVIEKE